MKTRKQRTKINSAYSSCEEILFGVPQGSILGPLLFNIFLCDLFFSMKKKNRLRKLCGWQHTVTGDSIEDVINSLENDSIKLFKWFTDNQMKTNKDKCHLLISSSKKNKTLLM